MKRIVFPFILIAQLVMLAGCTQEHKDLTGVSLAPVPVDQVKLYQHKPSTYDLVGPINLVITPDLKWDESGQADKAFDAMIAKAGSMGANGVLFELSRSEFDFLATPSYHGKSYQVPIRGSESPRTIVAKAILAK